MDLRASYLLGIRDNPIIEEHYYILLLLAATSYVDNYLLTSRRGVMLFIRDIIASDVNEANEVSYVPVDPSLPFTSADKRRISHPSSWLV